MALDQNAQYPVGTTGPSAAYPEGEAVNSTAPGALNGYPWEKEGINDLLGFQQALLRSGGKAASGVPDTALISQYLQMIVELASGRAFNYDESGAADAYVLDVQANQQAPQTLYDGLRVRFTPGNVNTGASTIKIAGTAVKNLKTADGNVLPAGYLALVPYKGTYNLAADEVRLDRPPGGEYIKLSDVKATGVQSGTFTAGAWQTRILNTVDDDTGGNVALAANQFTLTAGTYEISASAPAYTCSRHKTKLRNITDAIDTIIGGSSYSDIGGGQEHAPVVGRFTITASKVFELQHKCQTTRAADGLGLESNLAISEVYAIVELKKVG